MNGNKIKPDYSSIASFPCTSFRSEQQQYCKSPRSRASTRLIKSIVRQRLYPTMTSARLCRSPTKYPRYRCTVERLRKLQVLIERCIDKGMTRGEASVLLYTTADVPLEVTSCVWKFMETQNEAFFKKYYTNIIEIQKLSNERERNKELISPTSFVIPTIPPVRLSCSNSVNNYQCN
eukprot:TRINITY_DN3599_c0_g1_i2.p1 TRINITY_DN3599_c0_g1~~TRINITY_DN3599_c0_g1_i2.p1  ORF type:complete len:177 (-),score=16.18 TRINITY_DN3599_c0_g1_i2:21-551(-)